ncbi:MAG: FHA domain-containing protein [Bacteroidaceae bacterium]|nr:FHA domain-containing protein [Bacteroidaceae bacterium]
MKVYSIGREQGCDIVINDRTDIISRRHATLSVESFGKMTIVDQSTNGTYVNGIRISPNVPVPVTRKDNISFAHVARLDWNLIPRGGAGYLRWAIIALGVLVIVAGAVFGIKRMSKEEAPVPTPAEMALDSLERLRKAEELQKQEKQRKDSIEKAVKDSLAKLRPAQTTNKKENKPTDSKDKKKKEPEKKINEEGKNVKRADR